MGRKPKTRSVKEEDDEGSEDAGSIAAEIRSVRDALKSLEKTIVEQSKAMRHMNMQAAVVAALANGIDATEIDNINEMLDEDLPEIKQVEGVCTLL